MLTAHQEASFLFRQSVTLSVYGTGLRSKSDTTQKKLDSSGMLRNILLFSHPESLYLQNQSNFSITLDCMDCSIFLFSKDTAVHANQKNVETAGMPNIFIFLVATV